MAKKLYTGFEGYWANKTSDQVIPYSEIQNFWNYPLSINGNSSSIYYRSDLLFDSGARTLTGSRGSYVRVASQGSHGPLMPALAFDNSFFNSGYAVGVFFKLSSIGGPQTIFNQATSFGSGGWSITFNGVSANSIGIYGTQAYTSPLAILTMPGNLLANVWYYINIKFNSSTGEISCNFNGLSLNANYVNQGYVLTNFGFTDDGAGYITYFDDLCLNDLTGAIDNDLPPAARFFNATLNATDGAVSGWVCSPTGPTPQAALRDGLDTNSIVSQSSGQVVGEVLPNVSALYPSANRVLTMNFAMKNVVRDSVSAPSLSTRVNSGTNTDTVVGPGLATGNYFVPTFYKSGTTEFTVAEYNAAEAQLVST